MNTSLAVYNTFEFKRNPFIEFIVVSFLVFIVTSFLILSTVTIAWADSYKYNYNFSKNNILVGPCVDTKYWVLDYVDENNNNLVLERFCTPADICIDASQCIKSFDGMRFHELHYLSATHFVFVYRKDSIEECIAQDSLQTGNYGRLYIPDVGINVAINYGSNINNLSLMQSYVNRTDSACLSDYGCEKYLCDHYNQGFNSITKVKKGTIAYIKRVDGTIEKWQCIYGGRGINGVHNCLKFGGVSVGQQNAGGICMYTCNGSDSYNVHMRFFQRVK